MKQCHAIPGSFPLILNPLQGQEVHNEQLFCLHMHSFAVHSIMDKVPKELTDGLMGWYNLNANYIQCCLKVVQIKVPIAEAEYDALEPIGFEVVVVKHPTNEPVALPGLVEQGPQNQLVHSATWNMGMGCPEEECEALSATSAQGNLKINS